MKAYVVDKFQGSRRLGDPVGLLHTLLFHGQQDKDHPRWTDPCLGTPYRPQYVVHNGRWIPQVIAPTPNLVVSEAVKQKLAVLPHLEFHRVTFTKLIDYPPPVPGDFSHYDDPLFIEACETASAAGGVPRFHDLLPDVPEMHSQEGAYYEVVEARLKDVTPHYSDVRTIAVQMQRARSRDVTLELSPRLLADYPLVWWSHHIMTTEVLGLLGPFLDRHYFEVLEIDV
jgi:hypothetical protein